MKRLIEALWIDHILEMRFGLTLVESFLLPNNLKKFKGVPSLIDIDNPYNLYPFPLNKGDLILKFQEITIETHVIEAYDD